VHNSHSYGAWLIRTGLCSLPSCKSARDPIPDIPVPLQPGDAEPSLALNRLVHDVYDRAGYDLTLDDQQAPPPPTISEQDFQWIKQLLPS